MDLPSLNLPKANLRIDERPQGVFVFDVVRRKWVVLTPEEWVRQHFIHLLIERLDYPKSMMRVEAGLRYNRKLKRSDILVYRQELPFLLVECKSPSEPLSTATTQQLSIYNKSIRARHVAVSNGLKHFVWEFASDAQKYIQMREIPAYR